MQNSLSALPPGVRLSLTAFLTLMCSFCTAPLSLSLSPFLGYCPYEMHGSIQVSRDDLVFLHSTLIQQCSMNIAQPTKIAQPSLVLLAQYILVQDSFSIEENRLGSKLD